MGTPQKQPGSRHKAAGARMVGKHVEAASAQLPLHTAMIGEKSRQPETLLQALADVLKPEIFIPFFLCDELQRHSSSLHRYFVVHIRFALRQEADLAEAEPVEYEPDTNLEWCFRPDGAFRLLIHIPRSCLARLPLRRRPVRQRCLLNITVDGFVRAFRRESFLIVRNFCLRSRAPDLHIVVGGGSCDSCRGSCFLKYVLTCGTGYLNIGCGRLMTSGFA